MSTGLGVRFYYDGYNIVQKYRWHNSSESLRKTFVYEPRVDGLVQYTNHVGSASGDYSVHRDAIGSMVLLVNDQGVVEEGYRYDEFGGTTIVDGTFTHLTTNKSPVGNPYRFTARRVNLQLGSYGDDWYHYRNRDARLDAGRFVQRDPMGYVDASSLYVLVGNNTVNWVDPYGELFGLVAAFTGLTKAVTSLAVVTVAVAKAVAPAVAMINPAVGLVVLTVVAVGVATHRLTRAAPEPAQTRPAPGPGPQTRPGSAPGSPPTKPGSEEGTDDDDANAPDPDSPAPISVAKPRGDKDGDTDGDDDEADEGDSDEGEEDDDSPKEEPERKRSLDIPGEPGTEKKSWTKDGEIKQIRRYGEDGYAEVDT